MLVLERCRLQKRRVNPIRSAFPELHPRPRGWECFCGVGGVRILGNPVKTAWAKTERTERLKTGADGSRKKPTSGRAEFFASP